MIYGGWTEGSGEPAMTGNRWLLPAVLAAVTMLAGLLPAAAADTVACSFTGKIGAWGYGYAPLSRWTSIIIDEPDIVTELKAGESLSTRAIDAARVSLEILAKTELRVAFRDVTYQGRDQSFDKLPDWKGFTIAVAVDGKEIRRDPYRYDANTIMAWQPADDLVAALRDGKTAEFTLHDVGGSKDVAVMRVPLDGFAAAIDAAAKRVASVNAELAAGKTCAPVEDDWF
jgi:hypothetical protein